MAVTKLKKQDIVEALKTIDEKEIPEGVSKKYWLVSEDGKEYPAKYVVAVADHLANGTAVSTESISDDDAKKRLEKLGFTIAEDFTLFISKKSRLSSTDKHFKSEDYLNYGKDYQLKGVYFKKADSNDVTTRNTENREHGISNQTLLRLACQVFEDDLARLSEDERKSFPVCKNSQNSDIIKGFSDIEDEGKNRTIYKRNDGNGQFVFTFSSSYSLNIFSTIVFAQECLDRYGKLGNQFVLTYRKKNDRVIADAERNAEAQGKLAQVPINCGNYYSPMLIKSMNLIFRGAPGTGKSYLAKAIAADIISDGDTLDYSMLTPEQKKQVEFVQFHPSYDYTDFVEGLRPKLNDDGTTMGFELRDGIFKRFVDRARVNYENAIKDEKDVIKAATAQEAMRQFLSDIVLDDTKFETIGRGSKGRGSKGRGTKFVITGEDDKRITVSTEYEKNLVLYKDDIRRLLEAEKKFERLTDATAFLEKGTQQYHSYEFAIYNEINKRIKEKKIAFSEKEPKKEVLKRYVFIIDEINRGEISKIFGELFFSIDPCYRGKAGEVSTQYSNLHLNPDEKFYIPENVYIIGTMNDIDRSVDSFDFAMRRRFRFVELKADDYTEALDAMDDGQRKTEAKKRMAALNKAIANVEGLNENYQIGAAYFRKLEKLSFDELWTDYLQPLLQEYVRGMYDEKKIMEHFKKAYDYPESAKGDANEAAQDQG